MDVRSEPGRVRVMEADRRSLVLIFESSQIAPSRLLSCMQYKFFARARRFGRRAIGVPIGVYIAGIAAAVALAMLLVLLALLVELLATRGALDNRA